VQLKRPNWGQLSKALYDRHTCTHTHTVTNCNLHCRRLFWSSETMYLLAGNDIALTQGVLNLISNPPSCRKWQYPRMTWNMFIICIYWLWQQLIYKKSHCQKLHLEMKWGLFKFLMISCLLLLTPSLWVTGDQPYCSTECSLISLFKWL
jgi:hypothetical protein